MATCSANGLPRISSKALAPGFHSCGFIFDWHRSRGCVSKRERKVHVVGHLCIFVLNSMQTPRLLLPCIKTRQNHIASCNTLEEENLLAHLRASSFRCLRRNGTCTLAECEWSDRCFSGSEKLRAVSLCAESKLEGSRPRSAIIEERYLQSLPPRRVQTDR